jgi:hypothetical protein
VLLAAQICSLLITASFCTPYVIVFNMPGVFEKEHYVRECSQLDTIFLTLHLAMSLVQRRTIIAKQQVSLQHYMQLL